MIMIFINGNRSIAIRFIIVPELPVPRNPFPNSNRCLKVADFRNLSLSST